MSNNDSNDTRPLVEMSRQVKRFAEGVQRLELPDERGTAVATAATRFAGLVDGIVEAAVTPTLGDGPVATKATNELVASATSRLEQLITVFREDAAAGNTRLPDMDDLAIGIRMFDLEPDELAGAIELLSIENTLDPSAKRTALIEYLTKIGVPVAEVGIQPPVLIKTLFIAVLNLLTRADPKLQPLAIRTLAALTAIDELAQDAPAAAGDGPVTGIPRILRDVSCGDSFVVPISGKDRTARDDAFREAIRAANRRCRSGCIPILIGESVTFQFEFRCVPPNG